MTPKSCNGPVLLEKEGRQILDCQTCGYVHVYPMYSDRELEIFYEDHYSESTPSHLFALKVFNIEKWIRKGRVLDIGCWSGMQLEHFRAADWECCGLELNKKAATQAASKGFHIYQTSIAEFFRTQSGQKWDVINAAYILEHITDPEEFLLSVGRHLSDDGRLVVEVPNEFNPLQMCYQNTAGSDAYWIALPDHVNYFNREGIGRLFERTGWKVVHAECSFPMEMFLLMGDDYKRSPELGPVCFQKVVAMEKAIMDHDIRILSEWYARLYQAGIGRSLIYYLSKA